MPPKRKAAAKAAETIADIEDDVDMKKAAKPSANKKTKTSEYFGTWETVEDTFWALNSPELKGSSKVAGFDMDHTLIEPKGKGKFPANRNDWKWLLAEIKPKLQELNKNGYKIVIWTNQGGIEKGHQKVGDIHGKIIDMAEELGFPIQAFVAGATDHWRKPNTTMWEYFVANCNGGVAVDMKASFYCGDAAGRPKDWAKGRKKDFSCTDRKFAFNVGIDFHTPEEYFLGQAKFTKFDWEAIDPSEILNQKSEKQDTSNFTKKEQELVLFVGQPASGKSTLAKRVFVPNGYVHVNRDTLGTPAKCLKTARQGLEDGKSVVIDNTNPSVKTRAEYIDLANEFKVPVRCFVFTTPRELAEHLNFFRERLTNGAVRRIPDVGYNMYHKNYQAPTLKEGIKEIIEVAFSPEFDDEQHKVWFLQRTG